MLLEEFCEHVGDDSLTLEQMESVENLYILLDLDKARFCEIVKAIGLETLARKRAYYGRCLNALDDLRAKETYLKAQERLEEIEFEKLNLLQTIEEYDPLRGLNKEGQC